MTEPEPDQWESEIPADFIRRAYRCGNEFAWSRSDAIKVAQILQTKGYHILGVDTWIPTLPGPSPLVHDWDERYPISAVEFIKTFVWTPIDIEETGLELHFNFTVAKR